MEMESPQGKKVRISTIEGLRAIAFLGVVFTHTGLGKGIFDQSGHCAVSVFFVISGFVAVYSGIDRYDLEPSPAHNFNYLVKRIRIIYPLHVITTLAVTKFEFTENGRSLLYDVFKLGLNLLLVQEWLPM